MSRTRLRVSFTVAGRARAGCRIMATGRMRGTVGGMMSCRRPHKTEKKRYDGPVTI
jgi:hypothetical protein